MPNSGMMKRLLALSASLLGLGCAVAIAQVDPVAAPLAGTPPATAAILIPGKNLKPLPVPGSMFFTKSESEKIRLAIKSYAERGIATPQSVAEVASLFEDESFLNEQVQQPVVDKPYTYPQFFLNSLVYHSSDDWVIWLNDRKMTPAMSAASKDIHVVEITPDRVVLQWNPANMDRVYESWGDAPPTEQVSVNTNEGVVIFTLKPNQTFSSYVMRVLEGKVLPVTARAGTAPVKAPQAASAAAPVRSAEETAAALAAEIEAMPQNKKDEDRKGFMGLLGAYDRVGDIKP